MHVAGFLERHVGFDCVLRRGRATHASERHERSGRVITVWISIPAATSGASAAEIIGAAASATTTGRRSTWSPWRGVDAISASRPPRSSPAPASERERLVSHSLVGPVRHHDLAMIAQYAPHHDARRGLSAATASFASVSKPARRRHCKEISPASPTVAVATLRCQSRRCGTRLATVRSPRGRRSLKASHAGPMPEAAEISVVLSDQGPCAGRAGRHESVAFTCVGAAVG